MHFVEVPSALKGATYQVLFERWRPSECLTRDRLAQIGEDARLIAAWAEGKEEDVRDAYGWASKKIVSEIENRLSVTELASAVRACLGAIPRPPEFGA